jgi:hypothetical protein
MRRLTRIAGIFAVLGLALLGGCATETVTETGPKIQPRPQLTWRAAVGEVTTNFSDLHCSGVLVARDVIATASHCLFLESAQRPASPEDLIFRANLGTLQPLPPSRGIAYIAKGEGMIRGGPVKNWEVSNDWVLVRISPPITAVQPITTAGLSIEGMQDLIQSGNRLVVAGYGNGAYESLKVNERCKLLSQKKLGIFPDDSWLWLDCAFRKGDSGGAIVLLDGANQPALIGLMTGFGKYKTVPIGLGVNASQFRGFLRPISQTPLPPLTLAAAPLN